MKFTLRTQKETFSGEWSKNLVFGSDFSAMVIGRILFMHEPPKWAKGHWFASISYDGSGYVSFQTMKEARKYIEATFTREILGGRS